jgi:hypothetical protein
MNTRPPPPPPPATCARTCGADAVDKIEDTNASVCEVAAADDDEEEEDDEDADCSAGVLSTGRTVVRALAESASSGSTARRLQLLEGLADEAAVHGAGAGRGREVVTSIVLNARAHSKHKLNWIAGRYIGEKARCSAITLPWPGGRSAIT